MQKGGRYFAVRLIPWRKHYLHWEFPNFNTLQELRIRVVLKGSDLDHRNKRSDCLQNIHQLQHQAPVVLMAMDHAKLRPSWSPSEARCLKASRKSCALHCPSAVKP